MSITNLADSIPIGYVNRQDVDDETQSQVVKFVTSELEQAKREQTDIRRIWDDCWALYRGKEDWSDKREWQSKIALPKSFNSVKQAVNAFTRMLELSRKPWELEPVNPDDEVSRGRGERLERVVKYFLDDAKYLRAFEEGLESSIITGLGVWKVWWSLDKRGRFEIEQTEQSVDLKKVEMLEGRLKVKAIDPYNFYWIRGAGLNDWIGTIEESFVPLYQLRRMASEGALDAEVIKDIRGSVSSTHRDQHVTDHIRFDKPAVVSATNSNQGMGKVKITEYYGPLLDKDGEIIIENGYVVIANDQTILKIAENPYWHSKPPYVAFSPLLVPFREEGVGLVEMTREVDRGLSRLANMSMDTLLFNLTPMWEAYPEAYEDPEDLDSGMVPGKILRKTRLGGGLPPMSPVVSTDISGGAIQMMAMLDRSHQEGSLISELQQGLPRFRGVQSATEINVKANRENSFIASLAREIDERAIKPLIELSMDTVLQFIDTTQDPRIASILGIGVEELLGMTPIHFMEIISGNYITKVHGVNEQLDKIETLENLVQFMNIIGQNNEWMPYINQTELFKRILDSFPNIRDIDRLVNDPDTVEAQRIALQQSQLTPEIIRTIPGLVRNFAEMQRMGVAEGLKPGWAAATEQTLRAQQEAAQEQQEFQTEVQDLTKDVTIMELEARLAEAKRIKEGKDANTARRSEES